MTVILMIILLNAEAHSKTTTETYVTNMEQCMAAAANIKNTETPEHIVVVSVTCKSKGTM